MYESLFAIYTQVNSVVEPPTHLHVDCAIDFRIGYIYQRNLEARIGANDGAGKPKLKG